MLLRWTDVYPVSTSGSCGGLRDQELLERVMTVPAKGKGMCLHAETELTPKPEIPASWESRLAKKVMTEQKHGPWSDVPPSSSPMVIRTDSDGDRRDFPKDIRFAECCDPAFARAIRDPLKWYFIMNRIVWRTAKSHHAQQKGRKHSVSCAPSPRT